MVRLSGEQLASSSQFFDYDPEKQVFGKNCSTFFLYMIE